MQAIIHIAEFRSVRFYARFASRTDVSPCCLEALGRRGDCHGCGQVVAECRDCGGDGSIEELHGSQAGLAEPRTRLVSCSTCGGVA